MLVQKPQCQSSSGSLTKFILRPSQVWEVTNVISDYTGDA